MLAGMVPMVLPPVSVSGITPAWLASKPALTVPPGTVNVPPALLMLPEPVS